MEFASIAFIWVFLPVSLLLYYAALLVKEKSITIQNSILLLLSLIFYLWGGFRALILLILMILMNYGAGLWMDCFSGIGKEFELSRKGVYIASLLANLFLLVFFKYFNMMKTFLEILLAPKEGIRQFIVSLLQFEGTGAIHIRDISMPLAISFTVFQSISYLTDVYKRKVHSEKNLLSFSLYSVFFAQLVQGPIMRYDDLGGQIQNRKVSFESFSSGVKQFCYGLGKKVIIANTIALASDDIWGISTTQLCTAEAWLGVLLYTLQIYYDFSGYTDMAIGIGKMFGFQLRENFNYPYIALSVQEFWRRWHITLSLWFRDYIYIPLGGNRKGIRRTLRNISVVFLATGIWHGADLTFISWGIYFAMLMVIERLIIGKWLEKNPVKFINWFYTIFFVAMGWVLFRSPNLLYSFRYYGVLFSFVPEKTGASIVSYFNADLIIAIVSGILFSGIAQRLFHKISLRVRNSVFILITDTVAPLLIFVWSILCLFAGSYSPSIYGAF